MFKLWNTLDLYTEVCYNKHESGEYGSERIKYDKDNYE